MERLIPAGHKSLNKRPVTAYTIPGRSGQYVFVQEGQSRSLLPWDAALHLRDRPFALANDIEMTVGDYLGRAPLPLLDDAEKLAVGAGAVRALLTRMHRVGALNSRLSTN